MIKFQKYLIPLQSNIELSNYYATSYLQVQPSSNDFKKLAQTVSFANQLLHKNIKRLKQGHFDSINTPLKIDPCSPLKFNIPYHSLTSLNLEKLLEKPFSSTTISPHDLNTDLSFPKDFKFIGSKIQTNDFHISLLPLIRFNNEDETLNFHKLFKNSIPNIGSINFKFTGNVKIYPKFDYTKFFLALTIDKLDPYNNQLNSLQNKLASIRTSPNLISPGHVIGEIDNNLIDWSKSSLHMTIGVCNMTQSPQIDHRDLCFLNEILIKELHSEPLTLSGKLFLVMNNQQLRIT
ncbi:hypothetical protein CANINC_001286 [Pichia inconspicua]|uniref:Uncharacterized protein n=1 Tax=Pichia inconspicua TaxID=52247 RepID=A0A4T0X5N5_9ASCO|nr:hypothetical protein CANINC_001286 [[Candida] inconspicua]